MSPIFSSLLKVRDRGSRAEGLASAQEGVPEKDAFLIACYGYLVILFRCYSDPYRYKCILPVEMGERLEYPPPKTKPQLIRQRFRHPEEAVIDANGIRITSHNLSLRIDRVDLSRRRLREVDRRKGASALDESMLRVVGVHV